MKGTNDELGSALPRTEVLEGEHGYLDYGRLLVQGISRLLEQELAKADEERQAALRRPGTPGQIKAAAARRRRHIARCMGVVDERLPISALEVVGDVNGSATLANSADYEVLAVRWPVLAGVDGEGIYLRPHRHTSSTSAISATPSLPPTPIATAIAVPDADCSPEALAGILPGMPPAGQFARRLAELGCQVVVPMLVDRSCRWSGNPAIRYTNQPHREYVYRMAYQMGRHIIGLEVQKILALVDLFKGADPPLPLIIFGYGEGGLLALVSAALDERIDAVGVSGYFTKRMNVWQEPIYRNVWQLLRGGSDAELAACIAPRPLLIEGCPGPIVDGPPPATKERSGAAPGVLKPAPPAEVAAEVELVMPTYAAFEAESRLQLLFPGEGEERKDCGPGSMAALRWLLGSLPGSLSISVSIPHNTSTREQLLSSRPEWPLERQRRQLTQMVDFVQKLWLTSADRRRAFWKRADSSSPQAWQQTIEEYRRYFHDEVIGPAPPAASLGNAPGRARSRLLKANEQYKLYEVVLEVWPEVPAWAYLLIPAAAAAKMPATGTPGPQRPKSSSLPHPKPCPVVVGQHGLGGDPTALLKEGTYRRLARVLAENGFVVLAPQIPVIGPLGDEFRVLQRKANLLGLSLFSFITAIHRQWLSWLAEQPFVDADRMALYGLSYGGKTALRVPALLPEYKVVICSGDFNEWIMKTVSVHFPTSYMFTGEYEIPEFDIGNTFNHAEMAYLIAPRPFMVERGHYDPCGEDEWVAGEYAKVRRLYNKLQLGENTEIEFFMGGHQINLQGTLSFLRRHLG